MQVVLQPIEAVESAACGLARELTPHAALAHGLHCRGKHRFINASLLFAARHAIVASRPSALSDAIAFLYRDYEPHFFWWEVCVK